MKKLFSLLLVVLCYTASAQGVLVPFGGTQAKDTAYKNGFFRFDSLMRATRYASADSAMMYFTSNGIAYSSSTLYVKGWRLRDSLLKKYKQGGNAFGAVAVLGTLDANHFDIYTSNTRRLRVFATGNIANGTTDNGNALFITGNGRFDKLGVGGTVLGTGTVSVIGSSADFYGIGVRNTNTSGFTRLIGAADPGSSGTYWLAYNYYTNGSYPTNPNTWGWVNENGGYRWIGYGDYIMNISAYAGMNMTLTANNGSVVNTGFGGAPPAGATLASVGNYGMFVPNVMNGSQAELNLITKPQGGIIFVNSGNGTTLNSAGWWGWDGSTWRKFNTTP